MSNISIRESGLKTEKCPLDKEVSKSRFRGVMIIGAYLSVLRSVKIDSEYRYLMQQGWIKRRMTSLAM